MAAPALVSTLKRMDAAGSTAAVFLLPILLRRLCFIQRLSASDGQPSGSEERGQLAASMGPHPLRYFVSFIWN